MARLFGITLQDKHKVDYALTLIYGIGWSASRHVLGIADIDSAKRVAKLSEQELKKITEIIEKNYKVEGDLREIENDNLKRLRDIHCYRGYRHAMGLPARGQRTRSNARTRRGKKKTVGALTKEAWAALETQHKKK